MTDTPILDGRLRCSQPADGYRFAVDSLLLAWFVLSRRGRGSRGHGLELCGGSGVISAMILAGGGVGAAELLELQEIYHDAALRTAALNGLEERMRCRLGDLRDTVPGDLDHRPDVLYANPPFHPIGAGRTPPDATAAMARHEVTATMDDILDAAARLLPARGHLYLTYPAPRLGELLAGLPARRFVPTRLVLAWGDPSGDAARLLLEARKEVETPLTVGPAISLDGPWYTELCAMIDAVEATSGS
ncbi:MAG: hypothetical protein ABIK09_16220 [Pseudomonadota bacterium]